MRDSRTRVVAALAAFFFLLATASALLIIGQTPGGFVTAACTSVGMILAAFTLMRRARYRNADLRRVAQRSLAVMAGLLTIGVAPLLVSVADAFVILSLASATAFFGTGLGIALEVIAAGQGKPP